MPSQPLSTVPLARTAPSDQRQNWADYTYPTVLPQHPRNEPAPVSTSSPQRIAVSEYQWSDELVAHLLGLPPRSNFGGKFAIIADPGVDNAMRAQIFADQLRSQGVPISYVAALFRKDIPLRTPRALSTHIHYYSLAGARTGVVGGSLSLSATTLRIRTVCLASASAWRSTTPPADNLR
ncbi:hypothetical protein BJY52DRAFT_1190737 [Lactarius psammicola]|nr:hypothetical protein BJY52DRAFT_1190737 [Lactarius psammicola]